MTEPKPVQPRTGRPTPSQTSASGMVFDTREPLQSLAASEPAKMANMPRFQKPALFQKAFIGKSKP